MMLKTADDLYVTAIVKGDEQYVLIWKQQYGRDAIMTLGRWAGNAELSFTHGDAATLATRILNETQCRRAIHERRSEV